ncbi:uncharacterized protein LOC142320615 isoform X2 [Lycorma delicatula]
MKMRIEDLIDDKRMQTNKRNEIEFFSCEKKQNSCARIDAALKCKRGARSHLKVCSVWNDWGPQTAVNIKSMPKVCNCLQCFNKVENKNEASSTKDELFELNQHIKTENIQPSSNTVEKSNERKTVILQQKVNKKKCSIDKLNMKIDVLKKEL